MNWDRRYCLIHHTLLILYFQISIYSDLYKIFLVAKILKFLIMFKMPSQNILLKNNFYRLKIYPRNGKRLLIMSEIVLHIFINYCTHSPSPYSKLAHSPILNISAHKSVVLLCGSRPNRQKPPRKEQRHNMIPFN